eukprot:Skav231932  [mRNA]  locus=scaffold2283:3318:4178:- [translate_table: standard]
MRRRCQLFAVLCLVSIQQFDWLWIGAALRRTPQKSRIQRDAESRIFTETRMNVFYPWSKRFEETWEPPEEALAGSLLRGESGEYMAMLEWDSMADCELWLNSDQHLKDNTLKYQVCSGSLFKRPEKVSSKELENVEPGRSGRSVPEVPGRRLENPLKGLMPPMQSLRPGFDRPPDVDPAVLFAISAGEDVDIDLEDEILISGGDPSFLDDQKWQSGDPMSEEDGPDLEDDITASGGDPTFLDDQTWRADDEDESDVDLEDDITTSGGDPGFLDDSEWTEWERNAKT